MDPIRTRSTAYVIAGVLALMVMTYWLGARDQAMNERQALHARAVKAVLSVSRAHRARADSLENLVTVAVAAAEVSNARSRNLARLIDLQVAEIELETVRSHSADIVELLPRLLLTAGDSRYWTDSTGVRHLEGLRLLSLRAPLVPVLEEQVATLTQRGDTLVAALFWATARSDSGTVRIAALEILLEEGQKLHRCRIAFLLKCPSRVTSLGIGAALGVSLAVLLAN